MKINAELNSPIRFIESTENKGDFVRSAWFVNSQCEGVVPI
jgi:hypothetical protein